MTEKTALTILDEALVLQGYDGLVRLDEECGCTVDDLAPCGQDFASCRPAYKHHDPRPGRHTVWLMFASKEPPRPEAFLGVEE